MAYSVVGKALVGITYWVFEKYRVNDNYTDIHMQEKTVKVTGN